MSFGFWVHEFRISAEFGISGWSSRGNLVIVGLEVEEVFGFRVPGFGFRVSDFGSQIPDFGFVI